MTYVCRQVSGHGRTDKLLRIIVGMLESDCFLQYRKRNFITLGKIQRAWLLGARSSSDAWFWGVETPSSEVKVKVRKLAIAC